MSNDIKYKIRKMFGYQDNNDADNLIEFLDNT